VNRKGTWISDIGEQQHVGQLPSYTSCDVTHACIAWMWGGPCCRL
jgi:hypothetical protein